MIFRNIKIDNGGIGKCEIDDISIENLLSELLEDKNQLDAIKLAYTKNRPCIDTDNYKRIHNEYGVEYSSIAISVIDIIERFKN